MPEFNITPQMVFDQTNGGLDIFDKYCPGASEAAKHRKHFKSRNESTASSFISLYEGIYWLKDFGRSGKAMTAIQLVMEEENLDFAQTLNLLVNDFQLITADADKKGSIQYEYKRGEVKDGEHERQINFKVIEWNQSKLQTIFARTVWDRLKGIGRVPEKEGGKLEAKSDDVALRNATEICKKYGLLNLEFYSLITRDKKTANSLVKHEYYATDQYPIFMWEAGKWRKIYKPKEANKKYRFLIDGEKSRVMFGFAQANSKLEDMKNQELKAADLSWDSDSEKVGVIRKMKLNEIIICSGGSDAMNISGCGYAPIWFDNEMFNLTSEEYARLFSIAHRVYYLPDIDNSGIKEAIKMGKDYLNIELIFLPNNLLHEYDFRGNSCKDVRDFFRTHTPRNFDNLLAQAMPLRFWDQGYKYNKSGEMVKERGQPVFIFKPNPELISNFLFRDGFCQYALPSDKRGYIIIHRQANVVKADVNYEYILKHVKAFMKSDSVMRIVKQGYLSLVNSFLRSPAFGKSTLEQLPELDLEFKSHGRYFQYMFFERKAWKIYADRIEEYKLDDCPVNVWDDEVLPHQPKLVDTPFVITRNDDLIFDIEIKEKENHYLNFLIQTSRIHWQLELEILLEAYDFVADILKTGCKAKEEYLVKYKFAIDGPLLSPEQINDQKLVLISKLVSFGYLMHQYKDKSEAYCIWGTDHNGTQTTEDAKSHGGTGKSISFDLLNKYMKVKMLDGQQDELMKDKHNLEGTTKHTKLIYVDDAGKWFQFERFFAIVTTFTQVNPKGTAGYVLEFHESPKLAITSNLPPKKNDTSTRRRMWFLTFSNYYHKNTNGEFREDRTPKDDFGLELFGEDYPKVQWEKTHNLMARCMQAWFTYGKVNSLEDVVIKNIILNNMTLNFKSWADEMFHPDNGRLNTYVQRTPLFEDYQKKTSYKVSAQVFKDKVDLWCQYYEYRLNPAHLLGKDMRIMKSVEKEELRNGEFVNTGVVGTRECFYVDTGDVDISVDGVLDGDGHRSARTDNTSANGTDGGHDVPKVVNESDMDF
jgi:hypothetical protein